MIIFIGDKPSSRNKNPEVAFVGTPSYRRLLDWFFKLDLSTNDVLLCNSHNIKKYSKNFILVNIKNFYMDIDLNQDKLICLGKEAEKALLKLNITEYIVAPHPSPRNRIWNDSKSEKEVLDRIKSYIS